MYSLRRLVWAAYVVVAVLLALIILLGLRQYLLLGQYNAIIGQSEKAIFHFGTIRETITESLIDERWQRLDGVVREVEQLNSELVRLQESTLVPAEVKLALVNKIDLAGITIAVRRLMQAEGSLAERKRLQEQLRAIAEHLLQYDRIITSEARGRLLNFQMVVIGALGLIISLAAFSLNRFYRNTVVPLLTLSARLRDEGRLDGELAATADVSQELAEVIEGVRELSRRAGSSPPESGFDPGERKLLAETINETTNRLNGIINCGELLADDEHLSPQQRELIGRIIDSGNSIAVTWKKTVEPSRYIS